MKEQWRKINGFENYMISSLGRVKSLPRGMFNGGKIKERFLKPGINKHGYCSVSLCEKGKITQCKIHRLVAMAFIPNPNGLPIINHKNEIKTDNRVENLEWCDYSYNVNYGGCVEKLKKIKYHPIIQIDKNRNFVTTFQSAKQAGRDLGLDYRSICKCANGKQKTCGGYGWKWANA